MEQRDGHVTHRNHVARLVYGEMRSVHAGDLRYPLRFGLLNVHGNGTMLQEGGNSLDAMAHHRSTDVVGMVVGGEHSRHRHVVLRYGVDEGLHVVRRIDEQTLAG